MKTISVKVIQIPGHEPRTINILPGTTVRELLEHMEIKDEFTYVVVAPPQEREEVPSSYPLTADCELLLFGKVRGSGHPILLEATTSDDC